MTATSRRTVASFHLRSVTALAIGAISIAFAAE